MSVLCSARGEAEPAGEGWLVLFSGTSMTWLIFCPTTSRDISNGDQLFLACAPWALAGAELDRCPTSP